MLVKIGLDHNQYQRDGFSDYRHKLSLKSAPPVQFEKVISTPLESKSNNSDRQSNKLQKAFFVVGILSSSAFLFYMLRGMSPFGPNRQLLKSIKKANFPDNVNKKMMIEYDKIRKSMGDSDGSKNYIKNVLRLNWQKPTQGPIDIENAQKVLDQEHIGLASVKNEIIAFFKLQNFTLKNEVQLKEPLILCLDGPPGVGKTSIAESIAKAMGKPFERISLAGVSNKSFVKGSERVYKGSEPGQIIKALQNAGTGDPVILLDEIDKMGRSIDHGDPAFALLDALEPKQCKNFTDENIELPYDLSNVTFIITSNNLKNIPEVLKDRLEIIHIPPYGKVEKINIAKFTIEKMLNNFKLTGSQVEFSNEGINEIVNQTNDQGARKSIENVKCVFKYIIQNIESQKNNEKIIVDKAMVAKALANKQKTEAPKQYSDSNFSFEKFFARFMK